MGDEGPMGAPGPVGVAGREGRLGIVGQQGQDGELVSYYVRCPDRQIEKHFSSTHSVCMKKQ